jgi:hypothetical protein
MARHGSGSLCRSDSDFFVLYTIFIFALSPLNRCLLNCPKAIDIKQSSLWEDNKMKRHTLIIRIILLGLIVLQIPGTLTAGETQAKAVFGVR